MIKRTTLKLCQIFIVIFMMMPSSSFCREGIIIPEKAILYSCDTLKPTKAYLVQKDKVQIIGEKKQAPFLEITFKTVAGCLAMPDVREPSSADFIVLSNGKNIKEAKKQIEKALDIHFPVKLQEMDLNKDGINEWVVLSEESCNAKMTCEIIIYKREESALKMIMRGWGTPTQKFPLGFLVNEKNQGFPDLFTFSWLYMDKKGKYLDVTAYSFDGQEYQAKDFEQYKAKLKKQDKQFQEVLAFLQAYRFTP